MAMTKARCKHCGEEIYSVGGTIQPWRHTVSRSWFCASLEERIEWQLQNHPDPQANEWSTAEPAPEKRPDVA